MDVPVEPTVRAPESVERRATLAWRAAMGAVVAAAGVLHFWALTSVGWGNGYYAAAVRSMGSSWHAFLYASFDPGGFVSVDKPPLSLWVQVVSTKIVGYSAFGVLAPQALAATGSVLLIGIGLRRTWGRAAGLAAAAALMLVPINVMVAHTNNTDAVLVLCMTAAAVLGMEAASRGSGRWLLGASMVGGLCITAKMLAGAPVLPGIVLAYLWCAPRSWKVRVAHAVLSALTMAVVGLMWFGVVQLTPKDSRPYVGSTQKNSVFELAFERNGVNQVEGQSAFGGGGPGAGGPGGGRGPGGGGPGGAFGLGFTGGTPGALRLFNRELGSQAGWLLPMSAAGALSAVLALRFRPSAKLSALIICGSWLVGAGTVFSITKGIVHPYYLAGIGAPLAGLVGIGVGQWRSDLQRRRLAGLLAVVALAGTAVAQWTILRRFVWRTWVPWVAVALMAVAGLALVAVLLVRRLETSRVRSGAVVLLAAAPLLAPALWLQGSLAAGLNAALPYAVPFTGLGSGPANRAGGLIPNGGTQFPAGDDAAMVTYLRAQRSGERYLVGVTSAASAEGIIIRYGEPVMAMGGFIGSDPILTQEQLRAQITSGVIRYFLLPQNGGFGGFGGPGPFTPRQPAAAPGGGLGGLLPTPAQSGNLGGLLPGPATAAPAPAQAQAAPPLPGFPQGGVGGFGRRRGGGPFGGNGLSSWISSTCTEVPQSMWGATSTDGSDAGGTTAFPGGPTSSAFSLYDCKGIA